MSPDALKDVPIAKTAVTQIVKTKAEYLKTRQSDYQREKAFLERGLRVGDDEIGVLSQQQKEEEAGYKADLDELNKATALYSKGTLIATQVTDARRAVLLSATRKLQTTAQLMFAKKQQDDLGRKLEKLDDQRQIELLRDLQEATVKLNDTRERIQSVAEKLQYSSMVRSQLQRGAVNNPEITIVRKGEKGPERIVANEETELEPGDAVEVALPYQNSPNSPPPQKPTASNAQSGG